MARWKQSDGDVEEESLDPGGTLIAMLNAMPASFGAALDRLEGPPSMGRRVDRQLLDH